MAAKTYRKTALVDAEQFLPAHGQIPAGVYSTALGHPSKRPDAEWALNTLEGRHVLRNGDYVCTGPNGERWNVARERFEATYELADAARAQGAEVDPVAWVFEWKPFHHNNPWETVVSTKDPRMNPIREIRNVQPLYTTPPAPQPTEREKVLEERLQAIIDWADLAMKNADEFDSHGVRNLDGPVFDAARSALAGGEA